MEVYSENGMLEAHEPNCFHESMYMVANTHSNTVNVQHFTPSVQKCYSVTTKGSFCFLLKLFMCSAYYISYTYVIIEQCTEYSNRF
jgi:hypothetical protein